MLRTRHIAKHHVDHRLPLHGLNHPSTFLKCFGLPGRGPEDAGTRTPGSKSLRGSQGEGHQTPGNNVEQCCLLEVGWGVEAEVQREESEADVMLHVVFMSLRILPAWLASPCIFLAACAIAGDGDDVLLH